MIELGWLVYFKCNFGTLVMQVNLAHLAKIKCDRYELWNRFPKCRKLGCPGKVTFYTQGNKRSTLVALIDE